MVSRRQFMRGDFSARRAPRRPPWALAGDAFLAACTRCGDCVGACPTRIIVVERGYPEVDFKRGECTFCTACVVACAPGALRREDEAARPWPIRAQVAPGCLARHGVECRACGDPCPEGAIRFSPCLGGPPQPDVDSGRCTGCGACVAPCPVDAVRIT